MIKYQYLKTNQDITEEGKEKTKNLPMNGCVLM